MPLYWSPSSARSSLMDALYSSSWSLALACDITPWQVEQMVMIS